MNPFDRWDQMISLLDPLPDAGRRLAPRGRHRDDAPIPSSGAGRRRSAIIAAERHTDSSVLVSWSDPTRCRYDEQRWVSAKSRVLGRCALTGQPIRAGDPIYKPQWRGATRPANSREMIHASAVDQYVVRQSNL